MVILRRKHSMLWVGGAAILAACILSVKPCAARANNKEAQKKTRSLESEIQYIRSHLHAGDTESALLLLNRARKLYPDALSLRYLSCATSFGRAIQLDDNFALAQTNLSMVAKIYRMIQGDTVRSVFHTSQYASLIQNHLNSLGITPDKLDALVSQREQLLNKAEREGQEILSLTDNPETKILLAWLNAYRALIAARWQKDKVAIVGTQATGTLVSPQVVTLLDAQQAEPLQKESVKLFLQAIRRFPQDPRIYACFADGLVLVAATRAASRKALYSDPTRLAEQYRVVNWQQVAEEQIVESPRSYILSLYRKSISLDASKSLHSTRYGLFLGLASTGVARDETAALLRELADHDESNAVYDIDQLLVEENQSLAGAFEILRPTINKVKFRREFLASAPPDIYPILTNARRINQILEQILYPSYRALFRGIDSIVGTSQDVRERKKMLFFKVDLAERFMKSNFLFDRLLGLDEGGKALHQLLAFAPYLNVGEVLGLRARISRLEGMANRVQPETQALVLHDGRLLNLRFPAFDYQGMTISGPFVIVTARGTAMSGR